MGNGTVCGAGVCCHLLPHDRCGSIFLRTILERSNIHPTCLVGAHCFLSNRCWYVRMCVQRLSSSPWSRWFVACGLPHQSLSRASASRTGCSTRLACTLSESLQSLVYVLNRTCARTCHPETRCVGYVSHLHVLRSISWERRSCIIPLWIAHRCCSSRCALAWQRWWARVFVDGMADQFASTCPTHYTWTAFPVCGVHPCFCHCNASG